MTPPTHTHTQLQTTVIPRGRHVDERLRASACTQRNRKAHFTLAGTGYVRRCAAVLCWFLAVRSSATYLQALGVAVEVAVVQIVGQLHPGRRHEEVVLFPARHTHAERERHRRSHSIYGDGFRFGHRVDHGAKAAAALLPVRLVFGRLGHVAGLHASETDLLAGDSGFGGCFRSGDRTTTEPRRGGSQRIERDVAERRADTLSTTVRSVFACVCEWNVL